MQPLNNRTRVQFSLVGVLVCLVAGVVVVAPRPAHQGPPSKPVPAAHIGSATIEWLNHRQVQPPLNSEWRQIVAYIDHDSWPIAGAALRILEIHRHPELRSAISRLIDRALERTWEQQRGVDSSGARRSCFRVLQQVLA